MDADGVTFDAAGGAASAPYRLVVALHIAHPEPKKLVAPHAVVQVRDTGRLTATDVNLADDTAELHLRSGGVVRCAAERLARIDVAAGRWTWLSELRPVSAEQVPMLALGWDHHVDENVRGGPIVVAGQSFERGLGVHARSVLIFELDGAYREFVTSFGLDDDSGPYADVNVSILVDGRPRFDKTHVRRGILHGPIRLDVSRAGRIALIVDFGDNGDLQDRFDWVEPALIR